MFTKISDNQIREVSPTVRDYSFEEIEINIRGCENRILQGQIDKIRWENLKAEAVKLGIKKREVVQMVAELPEPIKEETSGTETETVG